MATTISSGTNPYKLGSPPDFGTLYSGRALDFDGVVDYISCGDVLDFGTDDFSIFAWIKLDVLGVVHGIVAKDTGGGGTDRFYFAIDASGILKVFFMEGGVYFEETFGGSALSVDTWYFVGATFDRSGNATGYVNGVAEPTVRDISDKSGNFDNAVSFLIGARYTTSSLFNGNITNVQVWNKVWSLSDVQYAYTHPEKLITHNSAVTSGTTISNLKRVGE